MKKVVGKMHGLLYIFRLARMQTRGAFLNVLYYSTFHRNRGLVNENSFTRPTHLVGTPFRIDFIVVALRS